MEIKVNIKRTNEDYYLASRQLYKSNQKQVILFSGFFILFIALTLMQNPESIHKMNGNSITWITIILISLIFWFSPLRLLTRWHFKKNPNLGLEEEITFNNDGLIFISQNSESKVEWSRYVKAVIAKDIILLYTTTQIFQNYPKRFFSDSQYSDLCSLVELNIKDTKRA